MSFVSVRQGRDFRTRTADNMLKLYRESEAVGNRTKWNKMEQNRVVPDSEDFGRIRVSHLLDWKRLSEATAGRGWFYAPRGGKMEQVRIGSNVKMLRSSSIF